MNQDTRNWIQWVRILVDPSPEVRGFSLEGLEFRTKNVEPVEDEMYGTLPGDANVQRGKFWVITEDELMRVCPKMHPFAQGKDWFFPVEFCDFLLRPEGVFPVETREATDEERAEALSTHSSVQEQLKNRS